MAEDKKFDMPGSVSIVTTGKKEVKKEDFETVVDSLDDSFSVGQSLDDLYDRFSKLIYLIDASGSMGEGMRSENVTQESFDWNEEVLNAARELVLDRVEDGDSILDPSSGVDLTPSKVKKMSVTDLKELILAEGIENEIGLKEIKAPMAHGKRNRSKMVAVKEAARDFVKARFKKFPDAQVMLFSFETQPSLLAGGISEEEVLAGINRLPDGGGGGTDIFRAVQRAVEHCKKRKDNVGAHHIVLVSDGMDSGATSVKNLLPDMKSIGIVFDFIFIQGSSSLDGMDYVIKVLRDVCEATGGEFTTVKSEQDFVQKFLAASTRKCLPPAPKQLK